MQQPHALEILCAREERRMFHRIGESIQKYAEARPFPKLAIDGGMRGQIQTSTIAGQSLSWTISGCTTLGSEIYVLIEIVHDDSWIPVVIISSSELGEPVLIVSSKHDGSAFDSVMEILDELITAASTRSAYERNNLGTLLKGKKSVTIHS